ncbi:hypothetical protein DN069_29315 [Streptacidiphilus pinicola]|uniref:non-specific serine/threonine protein kinase n=1 Tax=Streptacidiphilus pinicola TaxID=2219663 RepID=A0A2X0K3G5_9ACTN|nr:serine/threonine-protein kinase [Streptacidiphilus pinicola]RAG82099.1 hypothetical protein DN069_29315 [Streptacidiphilus pinicola]
MRALGGRYRLDSQAGRGGMGQVWRATDLERTVAVKVLPTEFAADPEFRGRFRREAKLLGGLRHEGIAVLHDVGEDGGEPFLVMEFVEGRTLAEATGGRPVDTDWALGVVRQLAAALAHSHRQGLIHRDIKSSNVMLTDAGAVKILDFGISKALSSRTTKLTGTGMSLGTPSYMSPEQIDGQEVDVRSDQYSLGCLLHELLTGRTPFVGDSPFAVMNQHLSKEPAPPSALNPRVPPAVDTLTLRLLAKAPADRFASMDALIAALPGATAVTPQPPHTPPSAAAPQPAPTPAYPPQAFPRPGAPQAYPPHAAPAYGALPHPGARPTVPVGGGSGSAAAAADRVRIRARLLGLLAQALFMLIPILVFELRIGADGSGTLWELALVANLVILLVGTPTAWALLARRPDPAAAAAGQAAATWAVAVAGATLGTLVNFLDWFKQDLAWYTSHLNGTSGLFLVLVWCGGLGWFALAYALTRLASSA